MNKKYKFDKVVFDRYAIWYMEIPESKSKLGVWRIIDLYPGTRPTKFAFRWKVKGKDKTQEQLDEQILNNAIRNFNKTANVFYNNRTNKEQQNQIQAA